MAENVKILELVSEILNSDLKGDLKFYEKCADFLKKAASNSPVGMYFISDGKFELKAQSKDFLPILEKDIDKINQNKIDFGEIELNGKKYIFSKLKIRNSSFGISFALKTTQNIEPEAFNAINCAISYIIKDYELSEIFKSQLIALQRAIEEKEAAYSVIKRQHSKLKELDKTKNAFLANISHELRTPLNAIIGFSQALACKLFGELNPKQEEYIKDIQTSSLHLLGMINEILDISKIESKAMKLSISEFSPSSAIVEALNVLSPLSEAKNIKVNFVDNCQKNIKADYQKIQQILYNLVSNSIKFTQNDGRIEIRTKCKNDDFILEVQDNGIGIEKKYHSKIFTKFVHIDNIYKKTQTSTGLGLTITRELVKLHKGTITLESEKDKGTTFTITLKGAIV